MYLSTTGQTKRVNWRDYFEAVCICWITKYYDKYNLLSWKSKSCWCNWLGDIPAKVKRTHTLIKYRCHNPSSPDYPRRWAVWIKVAHERLWDDWVRRFWEHIWTPSDNLLSIDRIDWSKGYEP